MKMRVLPGKATFLGTTTKTCANERNPIRKNLSWVLLRKAHQCPLSIIHLTLGQYEEESMNYAQIVLVLIILGCSVVQPNDTGSKQSSPLILSFDDCGENLNYSKIELLMVHDFRKEKVMDELAFCEYRFYFSDETIVYVSSNIFNGSSLNYDNRLADGVISYSSNRSLDDTIQVSGIQTDGRFWKEYINGTYTIGVLNSVDTSFFQRIVHSIRLTN